MMMMMMMMMMIMIMIMITIIISTIPCFIMLHTFKGDGSSHFSDYYSLYTHLPKEVSFEANYRIQIKHL